MKRPVSVAAAAGISGALLLLAAPADSSRRGGTSPDQANALAIQKDGKLVAVGSSRGRFALARYTTNGDLDASFGHGGMVVTDFGSGSERAAGVVIQRDGKIVAAGSSEARGKGDFVLARYDARGRLDRSFGRRGKVVTDFHQLDEASAIAIQNDGKFLVAGGANRLRQFALARYTVRGQLDPSFGHGGRVLTRFDRRYNAYAHAVGIQADGELVAAGHCCVAKWAFTRYNPDGDLDTAFGRNGKLLTRFPLSARGASDVVRAIVIQPDGNIVGAGGGADFVFARYSAEGILDPAFGSGGIARTIFADSADAAVEGVSLQSDGKIVAAGWNQVSGDDVNVPGTFALARYTADGRLDPTFGKRGKVLTRFDARKSAFAHAVAIETNGQIVAVGRFNDDFALARYTMSGRLDPSFGRGGKVLTDFGAP